MKILKWSVFLIFGFMITALVMVGGLAVFFEMQPPYWSQEAAGWVQAIGSIVAILAAIAVAWYQNHSQRKHDIERGRADATAMLRCFRADIQSHLAAVDAIFAPAMASYPDGQILSTFPISEDPFIMYNAFLPKLGLIENDALRIQIVEAYATANSFILTLRYNNDLIQTRRIANIEYQRFDNQATRENLRQANADLLGYAAKVRVIYESAVYRALRLKDALDRI